MNTKIQNRRNTEQPPVEDRYRLMVEETKDYAIFMLDPGGYVTTWNIGAERIKGYRSEEIIGKHFSVFYTPEDRLIHKPDETLADALRLGRSENEGWRIRKDGTRFWANGVLTAIYDRKGKHTGFGKITRDLSERKKAEEALLKQEAELAQTRKLEAIGQLAGGVAHDFNNILSGIMGVAQEVMLTLPPGDKRIEDLQLILESSQRAFDVTKQLLTFGRRQMVQPRVIDVNASIREFGKFMHRLIGENIALRFELGSIQSVKMDPSQLNQILLNLVVNARDSIGTRGTISVRTELCTLPPQLKGRRIGAPPGEYVILEVSDSGHGMDENTMAHLFEPFFTTKEKGMGTGLGLATVYGIVQQAAGDIEVTSVAGQGSVFRVFLPVVYEAPSMEIRSIRETDSIASASVLVVEDEPFVRQVISLKLKRLGYQVHQAKDGEQALRLVQSIPKIDVVLTDVIMPGMHGQELVEKIHETHPQIRAIYMSGYPENFIAGKDVLMKDVTYIEKSDLYDKLESVLVHVLGESNGARPSA